MLRLTSYLILLMLFLTACTSNNKVEEEEGFPAFSDEQFNKMIQSNPQVNGKIPKQRTKGEMVQIMEEILIKSPNDVEANYNIAKILYRKFMEDSLPKDCERAISYFSKVIELDGNYEKGHSYYNRMLSYLQLKQYDAALTDIERFVEVNNGQTPVNYESMRAEILFQQGNIEKACEHYTLALDVLAKDSLPIDNEQIWKTRCSN